ncbi:MAG: asparagine synthase-related protein [Gammaproteobacteria bacterium]
MAFLVDPASSRKCVIRDPSGFLPCFSTRYRGVTIFFSAAEDCASLNLVRFSVNWNYIARRVAFGPVDQIETALDEVSEVRAGECVQLHGARVSREPYWRLLNAAEADPIDDPARATKELRSTVRACVHAWASCYRRVVHTLSGGLDSSIVLGCLNNAPQRPEIVCLKHYTPHRTFDERPHARLAAQRAGCELIEAETGRSVRFKDLLRAARSVNPYPHLAFLDVNKTENRLATERGAEALFDGEGGDTLFGNLTKEHAASDYFRRHGFGRELSKLTLHVALQTNKTVWEVAADALLDRLSTSRSGRMEEILKYRKFASERAVKTATQNPDTLTSPLSVGVNTLRGTATQAWILGRPPDAYDPLGDLQDSAALDLVSPLLSQPVMEVCVRIPTYRHLEGGRDRGLARRSFAADVPTEILARLWKDSPVGAGHRALLGDIETVRELLLDGILSREQMLDRKSLEEALAGRPSKNDGFISEIFDHLITETWLRQWTAGVASSDANRGIAGRSA